MKVKRSTLIWCALAAAIVAVAVAVLRPARPHAPLREVPARELTLRGDRSYWKEETEPFTGVIFEKYPDGALMSRSVLSNGVLHGLSEGWHTNGVLQVREFFEHGVSHGVRTKWFASGAKLSEAAVEKGKIEGAFRRWHENGVLAEEVQMSGGVPHGISRAYHTNGARKAEVRLEQGKVIEQQFWPETKAPGIAAAGAVQ